MKITFELSPQLEEQLRACFDRGDEATMRELLGAAVLRTVEAQLLASPPPLSDEEFEALADEIADLVDAARGPNAQPLSDYAVSREGLYEDHL
jgi:antitoxin ParD1/3/4